ncbi:hypothetical protein ACFLX5_05105 [Chloroflexota bacterium]
MVKMWKKIDIQRFIESVPIHLNDDDLCFYARELISHGGYTASDANSLMNNFKKEASKRGTREWFHKERAVKQLAGELAPALIDNAMVFSIPTSKTKDHLDHDLRFEMLFEEVRAIKTVVVVEPIRYSISQLAAHDEGGTRDPDIIKSNYIWDGFGGKCPDIVYIVDDVLTTGGHFRACKDFVLEHCPETLILGYFFCKAVFAENE